MSKTPEERFDEAMTDPNFVAWLESKTKKDLWCFMIADQPDQKSVWSAPSTVPRTPEKCFEDAMQDKNWAGWFSHQTKKDLWCLAISKSDFPEWKRYWH
jgi:hypothetical protein